LDTFGIGTFKKSRGRQKRGKESRLFTNESGPNNLWMRHYFDSPKKGMRKKRDPGRARGGKGTMGENGVPSRFVEKAHRRPGGRKGGPIKVGKSPSSSQHLV